MDKENTTAKSSSEDKSKDECYEKVASIANEMVDRHGKDFAMGTLVLAARFLAEGKPLAGFESHGSNP